jgi:uncharacterized protein YdhG (YjbR/CyaY superfamily)
MEAMFLRDIGARAILAIQTKTWPKSLMSIVVAILICVGPAEEADLDKSGFGRTMVPMKKASSGNPIATLGTSSDAVDAYIAAVPEPTKTTLVQLREIIRSAVPKEAVEVISYGFPAFALPKPFFGYAAFKNHLSILPFSGSLFQSFTEELKPYTRTKSSLHLPFDQPLPATLIRKLVRARVAAIPSSAQRSSQKSHSW